MLYNADDGSGWSGQFGWDKAAEFCEGKDMRMCSNEEICPDGHFEHPTNPAPNGALTFRHDQIPEDFPTCEQYVSTTREDGEMDATQIQRGCRNDNIMTCISPS